LKWWPMSFEDDLKAVSVAPVEYLDVDVLLNGNVHVFRFEQMDGLEWAAETDRHPQRPGVGIDSLYHYNLRSLIKAVAPMCGGRLVDGKVVKLQVDPINPKKPHDKNRVDEWRDLWKRMDGNTFQRITNAIWALNERLPELQIEAAKKALSDSAKSSD
jgi:hypothetical protein